MIHLRLADSVLAAARKTATHVAVTDSAGHSLTYGDLADRIEAVTEFLKELGVKPGHRVAVLQHKTIDYLVTILSVANSGATYIPIDPAASVYRIRQVLDDCDPHQLITDPRLFVSEIPRSHDEMHSPPSMPAIRVLTFHSNASTDPHLAYILYTSGSTGSPKGVCVSHAAARAFVEWGLHTFPPDITDRVASIAPFHFDLSVYDIYCTLLAGCTLCLFRDDEIKNVRLAAQLLSELRISCIYSTPSFFSTLIQYGKAEKYKWTDMKRVMFAGEIFPVRPLHELMNLWSAASFYNLYGPTETNVCTWMKITKDETRTEPYPIGQLCTGHSYEIGPGNELLIGGNHVSEGYLNKADLTSEKYFDRDHVKWFRTGDVVNIDENGLLVFRGRIDRMVKRRGFRIEPAEIEAALLKLNGITGAAVVSKSKNESAELIAFVVSALPEPFSLSEAKRLLSEYLPEYMLPDQVVTIPELPVTTNGKIDYTRLSSDIVSS